MKLLKTPADAGDDAKPKSLWDKVISMTPVVMTVIATILAGLSSSEMSTAQYHRALAAQNQSKAGDQWSFFQAKRLRQANAETTLELLHGLGTTSTAGAGSLMPEIGGLQERFEDLNRRVAEAASTTGATAPAGVAPFAETVAQAATQVATLSASLQKALAEPQAVAALHALQTDELPRVVEQPIADSATRAALDAINAGQSEEQTEPLVLKIRYKNLSEAFSVANANADAFDAATKPLIQAVDRVGELLGKMASLARKTERASRLLKGDALQSAFVHETALVRMQADELNADFTAARLRLGARRYQGESGYNMTTARLYEVQVRRSSAESDRHRIRSKNFFYGMLAAQAAVTIATLSLAVKQRSLLWGLATAAGFLAITLGIYVYLFM